LNIGSLFISKTALISKKQECYNAYRLL